VLRSELSTEAQSFFISVWPACHGSLTSPLRSSDSSLRWAFSVEAPSLAGSHVAGKEDDLVPAMHPDEHFSGAHERTPEATKRLARLAGVVYLSLGIAAAIGYYHAPLVQGDLSAIGREITRTDLRFRIGVVSDVLSAVLAVPLAVLLYQLLKPVDKTQAAFMALLLLLAVPISFVVALNYVAAQMLFTGAPEVAALNGVQRDAMGFHFLRLHTDGVLAVEIFWGLWLLPFGLLVIRSHFLPRVLGILLIIAGVAYVAHSLITLLLAGQRFVLYERVTMLARAAGEFPIMFWLLIKGADVTRATSRAA